ncbi:Tar (HIV-1) RNA binding protein 1 [Rhizophlyctis rosea]|nr:Tar (HIV-1) RNA binding protein 1 [Rhizophlyctis rosea]
MAAEHSSNAYASLRKLISQADYDKIVDTLYAKLSPADLSSWSKEDLVALVDAVGADFELQSSEVEKRNRTEAFRVRVVQPYFALTATDDGVKTKEDIDSIGKDAAVKIYVLTAILYPDRFNTETDSRTREHFFTQLGSDALAKEAGLELWVTEGLAYRLHPTLDVIKSLVKRLRQDSSELAGNAVIDETLERVFIAVVALMGSGDKTVRANVGNEVLPAFLRWDVQRPGQLRQHLRREQLLFDIIQEGLCGEDPIARKYSIFLLKRVIDFSKKYQAQLGATDLQWPSCFFWDAHPPLSKALSSMWDEFHLLYDTADESFVHLVEPVIPKFSHFLAPRQIGSTTLQIHPSWWCVIINRGIANTAHAIRRRIYEYVISIQDVQILRAMGQQWEFLFEQFFPRLQEAALFSVPGLGNFVSAFGESLRGFVVNLIKSYDRVEDQARFMRELAPVIRTFRVPIGVLYLLQGLYELACDPNKPDCKAFGEKEVGAIRSLLEGEYAVTVWSKLNSRRLLRQYMLTIFPQFVDLAQFTYDKIARLINTLLAEDGLRQSAGDVQHLRTWIESAFPVQEGDISWLASNVASSVTGYINDAIEQFHFALETLWDRLERLEAPYAPVGSQERACLLLAALTEYGCQLNDAAKDVLEYVEDSVFTAANLQRIDSDTTVYRIFLVSPGTFLSHETLPLCRVIDAYVRVASRALNTLQTTAEGSAADYASQCAVYAALRMLTIALDGTKAAGGPKLLRDDKEIIHLVLDQTKFRKVGRSEGDGHVNWTELQNLFTAAKYDCARGIAEAVQVGFSAELAKHLFERCVDELESATHATGSEIMLLMSRLMAMDWEKPVELIGRAVSNALPVLEENWTNSRYFPSLYDAFVKFAVQPGSLGPAQLSDERSNLKQAFHKILSWADVRIGLVPRVAEACYGFWVNAVSDDASPDVSRVALSSLRAYIPELVEMLLFGPTIEINKDDHKIDAAISLKLNRKNLSGEEVEEFEGTAQWNFSLKDYTVRVRALDILSRLRTDRPEHREVATAILDELLQLHLSKKYHAKFINNGPHRKQLRLWIAVHLLLPFITPEKAADSIRTLMTSIELEQQISTRYYIDWALIRVVISYPDFGHAILFDALAQFDKKAHVVSSFISVVHHIGRKLDAERQVAYYEKLLNCLMPWTSSNHFTIRLFAQFGLYSAWAYCSKQSHLSHLLQQLPQISSAAQFISDNVECARHREKCQKAYFLGGGFDPLADVNLEFLLRGCLAVSGVAEDERISVMAFEKVNPLRGRQIPLRNPAKSRDAWAPDSAIKLARLIAGKDNVYDEIPSTNTTSAAPDAPIQKKIVPWEAMMETDIDLSREREDRHKKRRNPLIVVASLISKAPNLGGLCRTCEIFNAELLVLGSLKVTEDPGFTGLAVTADRWMPMQEVREPDLEEYLLEKKTEGYALLGIEQATRSVSLETFTFPEKCLLLLGKEKEGIPVHLLPLLDHVLEIPQFGIIRSLNVHVSGALIVWEYTKQRIEAQSSE